MEAEGPGQNATDKRFFWLALYAQPALWVALAVVSVVRLQNPIWLSLVGTSKSSFIHLLGKKRFRVQTRKSKESVNMGILILYRVPNIPTGASMHNCLGDSLTWMVCSNCVDLNNHEHAGVFKM